MATKQARVSWKGDLENGTGTIEQVGSGALGPLAVSWAARTGAESGMTSPEELIAAAHASCFSMAFSARLAKAGTPPDRLEDSVATAEDAKENCPVSSALKGNVQMSVTARLAS